MTSVRTQFVTIPNFKFVLGSNVKGPNNKFVEHGCQRTKLIPKEKQLHFTFIDGLTPI